MLKIFKRTGLVGAVATATIAASLLLAPSAQAATHGVSDGYVHQNQYTKVAKHEDVLKLDAATKKSFLFNAKYKGYAATSYRVTVLDAKKHVLLRKTVSGYKAQAALQDSYTHKSFKTDAAFVKQVKKVLALSEAKAKKLCITIANKITFEFTAGSAIYPLSQTVQQWVKENPAETTFDNYLPGTPKVGTQDGVTFALTGTPQAWKYTVSDKASGLSAVYDSATGKIKRLGGWIEYNISTKF